MDRSQRTRRLLVGAVLSFGLVAAAMGVASATHIANPTACSPETGTLADGVTQNTVNTNAGPTKLRTRDQVRILQTCNVGNGTSTPPAFSSGWHTHPGPILVNVTDGTLTFYASDCSTKTVSHGQVYLESANSPLVARNEGSTTAKWITTLIIPVGVPSRTDVASRCGIS